MTKKQTGLCSKRFCRKKTKPGSSMCYMHAQRQWRESHPIESAFHNKKTNAKLKGHAFTLTLDEFRQFMIENNMVGNTDSKSKTGLTIDRIDPSRGYEIGNIQVKTRSANSRKRWVDYWQRQQEIPPDFNPDTVESNPVIDTDLPFDQSESPLPF